MSQIPAPDKSKGSSSHAPRQVAKPDAGHPAAVPDHAFEASIAGEEDPGASLDNNANGVPPPKDTVPVTDEEKRADAGDGTHARRLEDRLQHHR